MRSQRGVLVLSLAVGWCGLLSVSAAPAQTTLRQSFNDGAYKARQEDRYDEAEKLYRAAIREAESAGVQDSTLSTNLNGLGWQFVKLGKYAEAEPLYIRSLAIDEQKLGADHPSLSRTLYWLGVLKAAQQSFVEAEIVPRRALSIQEGKLPQSHGWMIVSQRSLAGILQCQGKTEEAAALYEQALAVLRKQPRTGDANEAHGINETGNGFYKNGQYAQAKASYWSALGVYEKALGPEHVHVAAMYENVARALRKQDRNKEADVYTRRAAAIRTAGK